MAAKKKTIEQKDLASVGVSAQNGWSEVIDAAARPARAAGVKVNDATPRPPRAAGVKVTDEGNGGNALVEFLAEKKLI
jgi:electron transfer flavoprotein beta subunit